MCQAVSERAGQVVASVHENSGDAGQCGHVGEQLSVREKAVMAPEVGDHGGEHAPEIGDVVAGIR